MQQAGVILSCSAQAYHCSSFLTFGAQALGHWASAFEAHGLRVQAQYLWHKGFAAQRHVGSSLTRDGTDVSCFARQILNHWTTREAAPWLIVYSFTGLCYHRHYLVPEHFHHSNKKPCIISSPFLSPTLPTNPRQPLIRFLSLSICPFCTSRINEILPYMASVSGFFHFA